MPLNTVWSAKLFESPFKSSNPMQVVYSGKSVNDIFEHFFKMKLKPND